MLRAATSWHRIEQPRKRSTCRGLLAFQADVGDDDAAGVKSARRDGEADLRGMERHREIGVDDRSCDLARGGIDP